MAMLALSKSIGMASLTRIRPVMSRLPDMTITGMENEVFYLLHSRTPKKITHNDSSHLSSSSLGFQRLAAAALVVNGSGFCERGSFGFEINAHVFVGGIDAGAIAQEPEQSRLFSVCGSALFRPLKRRQNHPFRVI